MKFDLLKRKEGRPLSSKFLRLFSLLVMLVVGMSASWAWQGNATVTLTSNTTAKTELAAYTLSGINEGDVTQAQVNGENQKFYKFGNDDAFVRIEFVNGSDHFKFMPGDELTVTMLRLSEGKAGYRLKSSTRANVEADVAANTATEIKRTLTADDIDDDGKLTIYRANGVGFDCRYYKFSVKCVRYGLDVFVSSNDISKGTAKLQVSYAQDGETNVPINTDAVAVSVKSGSNIEFTATPASGKLFWYWKKNGADSYDGTNPLKVYGIADNLDYQAVFTDGVYHYVYTNDSYIGTVKITRGGNGDYTQLHVNPGTPSISFVATEVVANSFKGWYTNVERTTPAPDGADGSKYTDMTYKLNDSQLNNGLTLWAKFEGSSFDPALNLNSTDKGGNVQSFVDGVLTSKGPNDNLVMVKDLTGHASEYTGIRLTANGDPFRIVVKYKDNGEEKQVIKTVDASTENTTMYYSWYMIADVLKNYSSGITKVYLAGKQEYGGTYPSTVTFSNASLVNITDPISYTKEDGYVKFNIDSRTNLKNGGFGYGSNIDWVVKNTATEKFLDVNTKDKNNNYVEVFNKFSNETYSASDYTGVRIDYRGDHVRVIAHTTNDGGKNYIYTAEASVEKTSKHIGWEDFTRQYSSGSMSPEDIANIDKISIAGCEVHAADESTDIYNVWLDKMYHYTVETLADKGEAFNWEDNALYYDIKADGKPVYVGLVNATGGSRHKKSDSGCDGLILRHPNNTAGGSGESIDTEIIIKAPAGYGITKVKVGFGHNYSTWVEFNSGNYVQLNNQNSVAWETNSRERELRMRVAGGEPEGTVLHITYVTFELVNNAIDESLTATTAGRENSDYWLYVPKKVMDDSEHLYPVVFSLHGTSNDYQPTNEGVQNYNNLADQNNFIVVYPRGTNHMFPGFGATARGWEATGADNKDIQFFKNIIAALRIDGRFKIDEDRIYITGFSNGGMMTYAAANAMSDVFAAYAAVSGYPVNEMHHQHNANRAVPFLHIHGKEDGFVKYAHTPTIIDNMVARNGLPYTVSNTGADGYDLYKYEAAGKQPYWFYAVDGMGHNKEKIIGGVDSKQIIWDFFKDKKLSLNEPTTIEFAPDFANVDNNHGWTTNFGTILAQYGESGGYSSDHENTYHSIQLKKGTHFIKLKAQNTNTSKMVNVRLVKLAELNQFAVLGDNTPVDYEEEVVIDKKFYCTGDIVFKYVSEVDAEYRLEIIAESANSGTTISNVSIETNGTPTDNEADNGQDTDFAGFYRFNNRLAAQWNFDQCDGFRFNTLKLNSEYWKKSGTEDEPVYIYKKAIGTQVDADYTKESSYSELTYDGTDKLAITAGLKFNAPANSIKIVVTMIQNPMNPSIKIQQGARLQVDTSVKMLVPYVENTFRNDMGSVEQPGDANRDEYMNCVHHWKRDILYVSVNNNDNVWNTWSQANGWKEGLILNKCIDDNTKDLFNSGGEEKVNGVFWYKMNYMGNYGTPCVLQFQKPTTFNRLAVNRNLTYSFYSEYISDFGRDYEKPRPKIRVIGSPSGAQVANIGPFLTYEGAIAFTYGGWKSASASDVDLPGAVPNDLYDYYNAAGTRVSDQWSALGVYSGQPGAGPKEDGFITWDNMGGDNNKPTAENQVPIASDGFPVLSMNYEPATSGALMPAKVGGETFSTTNDTEEKDGKTIPNYHPTNDGKLYVGASFPYKANITPWSLPSRGAYLKFEPSYPGVLNVHVFQQPNKIYYIADEFGVPQSAKDVFTKTASNSNEIHKVTPAGVKDDADGVGFKLTPKTGKVATADYVKYSFNVYPGKTYYMFSNETGMGFAGFYYEPFVERKDVSDEFGRWDVQVDEVSLNNAANYTFPTLPKASANNGVETIQSPKEDGNVEYKIHYSKKAVKVTLDRSFVAGQWNSICLPYSMNQVQMEQVFGVGSRVILLRDLQDAEHSDNNKVTLNFICHENQDIIAGYPYFILPTKSTSEVTSYACLDKFPAHSDGVPSLVSVASVGPNTNTYSYEEKNYNGLDEYTFKGTFSQTTVKKGSWYVGKDDDGNGVLKKLTADNVTINPYRAWLELKSDDPHMAREIGAILGIDAEMEGDATSISIDELLENSGIFTQKTNVYSVDGKIVRANAENLNGLPKGIYIANGKKFIVK